MRSFSIGKHTISPNLLLAPMSGVTNSAFRRLIKRENPDSVGLMVTEFISVEAMTRNNPRSLEMMKFYEEERPISIQIFGYDIDRMVDAAQMVEEAGADIVDINCGCPVPKVVRRGGGCELMRQEQHLEKILTAVRKSVSIPLTLKIRAGWDDDSRNAVAIAKMAENSGVEMLTVHGRTRVQLYRGLADWDFINEVARSVKIPVIGSGDIVDQESAQRQQTTDVAGLMIGRGALSNPWIFSDICAGVSDTGAADRKLETEIPRVMRSYRDLLGEIMPDKGTIGKLKQFASQSVRGLPGASYARRSICLSQTVDELMMNVARWEAYLNEGAESSLYGANSEELFVPQEI
jgi:tRNA-dihydrouridine synthase B